jgi:hypothetical protein
MNALLQHATSALGLSPRSVEGKSPGATNGEEGEHGAHGTSPAGLSRWRPPTQQSFIALQNAYRVTGGLGNGQDLAARLHMSGEGSSATLARWIGHQQVLSFTWDDEHWLPMFQFDPRDLSLRRGLRQVLAELFDVMDGWEIALWFAQPNDALKGHTPASQWLSDWPAVFQAVRLQRFVMKG